MPTVATIVPEGVLGLLLLAPALPFAARWLRALDPEWKLAPGVIFSAM